MEAYYDYFLSLTGPTDNEPKPAPYVVRADSFDHIQEIGLETEDTSSAILTKASPAAKPVHRGEDGNDSRKPDDTCQTPDECEVLPPVPRQTSRKQRQVYLTLSKTLTSMLFFVFRLALKTVKMLPYTALIFRLLLNIFLTVTRVIMGRIAGNNAQKSALPTRDMVDLQISSITKTLAHVHSVCGEKKISDEAASVVSYLLVRTEELHASARQLASKLVTEAVAKRLHLFQEDSQNTKWTLESSQQVQALRAQLAQKETEVEEASKQLRDQKQEITKLQMKLQIWDEEKSTSRIVLTTMNDEATESVSAVEALLGKVGKIQEKQGKAGTQLESLLQSRNKECTALATKLAEAKQRIQLLERSLMTKSPEKSAFSLQLDALHSGGPPFHGESVSAPLVSPVS
ncbi:hypothetical protein CYMTET_48947 [Cymbomonas tetramitiformis]|uniref:Uncharacterized protein n=1 Tax=Cymbomonas tetramitiformis TaxID=36881 RepID=A0AAE0EUD5_9CHLO|nr:hypothetical protein CYMTET_48947 [Cymbomonas tetramitiformis]